MNDDNAFPGSLPPAPDPLKPPPPTHTHVHHVEPANKGPVPAKATPKPAVKKVARPVKAKRR